METKGPSRDNCGSYYKVGFTIFTRTKFLDRKPTPTLLQALGRVTSYRKFHRDEYSSSVPRCFQAVGNLSSNCVYETCGARWLCLPLCWLLSVTHWVSLLPGMPSDLDPASSSARKAGTVFPFSSLSRADAFVKHNNKLLGNWNEKWRTQKCKPFSGFTEQTWNNSVELLPKFLKPYSQFLRVPVSISGWPKSTDHAALHWSWWAEPREACTARESRQPPRHPRLLPGWALRRDGDGGTETSRQKWPDMRCKAPCSRVHRQSSTWIQFGSMRVCPSHITCFQQPPRPTFKHISTDEQCRKE